MNKLSKLFLFAAVAVMIFAACSDDSSDTDRGDSLVGSYWEYDKPICEISYPQDSIEITMGMGGEKMSFAPDQIVALYNSFAGSKMEAYMRYLLFEDANTMNVGYIMDGEDGDIDIEYLKSDKYLQIDMSVVNPAIPPISVNYDVKSVGSNKFMEIYFEKEYITIMAQQMLPTFMPVILPEIIPSYNTLPEMAQQAIAASFTDQIIDILNNMEVIKVGLQVK